MIYQFNASKKYLLTVLFFFFFAELHQPLAIIQLSRDNKLLKA